jgi:methyl-accepting chemotaxis protein
LKKIFKERGDTMFNKLKLSSKLWGFTGLLLLAVLIVAANSMWSIRGILTASASYSEAAGQNAFMIEKEVDHLIWMGKVKDLFVDNAETLDVQMDHTKCGLGKFLYGEEGRRMAQSDPKLAALLEEIKAPHKQLHESARLIKDTWHKRHKGLTNLLKDRLDDHRKWAANVSRIVLEKNSEIQVEKDPAHCAFGKFLASADYADYAKDFPALREAMEAVKAPHAQLHESAREISALVKDMSYEKAAEIYENVTLTKLEEVERYFKAAIAEEGKLEKAQADAHRVFETRTLPAIKATQSMMKALSEQLHEIQKSTQAGMISTGSRSQWSSGVVTVMAFVLGALLSFFIIRSIVNPIKRIIDGLSEGSEQVASASGQVSSASQQLAEGASEQAASLEETSSSLEEMSSMTTQNAENATEADHLMKDATEVVSEADDSMSHLTVSMNEISKASEETQKIVKTIDEIAFQTNLLALNAAVEAARAGEAGSGFAVVADEVRNLAMRAADAAKNTAGLIEETVKKIKGGSDLVDLTNEAFGKVSESSSKVGELVAEIAAASKEQADGIEQVNMAVNEMDKVIQQNAANAEENASASEEMSAQAELMKDFVGQLVTLVGGNGNNRDNARLTSGKGKGHHGGTHPTVHALNAPGGRDRVLPVQKTGEVHPEQVIPMGEGDFEDF